MSIGRELTKLHEEHWRGSLAGAVTWAEENPPRGELVVVVDGAPPPAAVDAERIGAALAEELRGGASARDAAAAVSRALGVPKRRAYELAVQLRDQADARDAS